MSTQQQGKAVGTTGEAATITARQGGQVGGGFDIKAAGPLYGELMNQTGNLRNALIGHASPDTCVPLLGVVKSAVTELEAAFPGDHWQLAGADIMARLDAIGQQLGAGDYNQCLTLLDTFQRDVRRSWTYAGQTTGVGTDATIGADSSPPESRR